MNDGNAVVMEGCTISSECFFGFISASAAAPSRSRPLANERKELPLALLCTDFSHPSSRFLATTDATFLFADKTQQGNFFAAAYGCSFSENWWHISAGKEILEDEEEALCAANFEKSGGEFVTKHNSEWLRGTVQPWRRGWLSRGKAA
jgi:hypothetical protein